MSLILPYRRGSGNPQSKLVASDDDIGCESKAAGPPVPTHHSPLFKIDAEESAALGVEATVIASEKLLQADRVAQR